MGQKPRLEEILEAGRVLAGAEARLEAGKKLVKELKASRDESRETLAALTRGDVESVPLPLFRAVIEERDASADIAPEPELAGASA